MPRRPKRSFFDGWTITIVGTPHPLAPDTAARMEAYGLATVFDVAAAHPEECGPPVPTPSLYACEQMMRRADDEPARSTERTSHDQ